MRVSDYSFGSVRVDGVTYDDDLIIDRGKIRKRNKAASRKYRGAYGHTPLSAEEDIPWRCRRLVIGTGAEPSGGSGFRVSQRSGLRRARGGVLLVPGRACGPAWPATTSSGRGPGSAR